LIEPVLVARRLRAVASGRQWPAGLWRQRDFRWLWLGQTVSLAGSEVTRVAMPMLAVVALGATPVQMGLLGVAEQAPWLLFGLLAGVWVDRTRRRPLLIGCDLGRALFLLAVPVGAFAGMLSLELLALVLFGAGILDVLFTVAYQSYVPSLVRREHLVEANSKLEISRSAAQVGGPGLGGLLTQLMAPALVLAFDAASFLFSAASLRRIRASEPEPAPTPASAKVGAEIAEGLRAVSADAVLRAIAGAGVTYNCFTTVVLTLFAYFALNELALPPVVFGLIMGVGGLGFVLGALVSARVGERLGIGRAMVASLVLVGVADLLIPLADGPLAALVLAVANLGGAVGLAVIVVQGRSLRQAMTPAPLMGRVNATFSVLNMGVPLLGALLGGVLGEVIGVRFALFVGAAGQLLAVGWLLRSPIPAIRELPPEQ
jgi:MFS family permease